MPRKKGKKQSHPEQSRCPAIPGLSSVLNAPSSSSREQPPAAAGGSRQSPREQIAPPAQLPARQPQSPREQTAPPAQFPRQPQSSREQTAPPAQFSARQPQNPREQTAAPVQLPRQPQNPREETTAPAQLPARQPQRPREQTAEPAQLPRQPESSGTGRSRQETPDYEVPGRVRSREDLRNFGEERPSTSETEFREKALVPAMPRKPEEPGRNGRIISLMSNLYPLKFNSCLVYHYDIEIIRLAPNYTDQDSGSSPDSCQYKEKRKKLKCLNTKLSRKVFKKLSDENFRDSLPVYDGKKNVYSMNQLPIGEEMIFEVRIEAENPGDPADPRGPRMDIFEVKIKPVEKEETHDNIINLEPLKALYGGQTTSVPLDAVMVLETVLRYQPCLRFVPVGRNFFSPPDYPKPLGNGKEVWLGHHQSVRLAQTSPVVNLDIAASPFYESIPVIEYIEKLTGRNLQQGYGLEKSIIPKINNDIKNICVVTNHLPYRRKYCIEGISEKSANKEKFQLTENNQVIEITVEDYYRRRYNLRLRYPYLPCLKVKNRDSFLPLEFCKIVKGQPSNGELNPRQQSEMIKFTVKPPRDRFEEIDKIYENSDYDNDPFLLRFGLRVHDEPLMVNGRVMEAPNLIYKDQRSHEYRERPRNGTWNMIGKQFFTGTRINVWTLLSFANESECSLKQLEEFARALQKYANQQGVRMRPPSQIKTVEAKLQNVRFCIQEIKTEYKAELIFIVLPVEEKRDKGGKSEKLCQILYSEVKRVAETTIGIVTQCVKGKNVVERGTNASFVTNLCLKMNAKMGGVNNSMVPAEVSMLPTDQILFVGADVNHPAPTDCTNYSFAAAVGNVDNHPSRYAVIVRAQKKEKNFNKMVEVILNMRDMMRYLLLTYYRNTKTKPKKIVIYRDGVSDGQFSDVQNREIKWIKAACTSLEAGYEPGITFLVIQKRHHVRFLEQRRGNPPAGTVVDTTVTHPLNYDFFLQSHGGMKGTSRFSYYTALAEENKYSADALQKMTYALCHTYARCTKSISLPAPVQYAHLAAYRARRHLHSHLTDMEARGEIQRREDGKFHIEIGEVQKIVDVLDCMKDRMYYA